MRISDLIKMGLRNLSRRKARTILTVLGVVIGTLSIIIMRSIGHGMEANFESQIKQLGSLTTITVNTYGDVYDENGNYVESKKQKLDDKLVETLKGIDHVRAVSPVMYKSVRLYSGKYTSWAWLTIMDGSVFKEFDFPELSEGDYDSNPQIIFGYYLPDPFYEQGYWRNPTKEIDFKKDKVELKFQEYPVNERKKEFSYRIDNIAKMVETKTEYDYNSYMDLNLFKELYRKYCNTLSLEDRKKALKSLDQYEQIKLNVDNIDNVEEVLDKIKELGYAPWSMMQYIKPMIEASETLQLVLLALGTIAMVVSAISIANTMVMSIYERTKEIGIMKVLGCVIKDIRKLFLFEAGMIGFLGGLVGIVLGYVASFLINKYGEPLFGALMSGQISYDMQATTFSIIPIYLPFAAMALAMGVGVLSGYFPARRATKISAIEAMKSEG